MQLQEVSHNLQETKCSVRRLQTLLFYTSGDVRKSCASCGKPPEDYGSLTQVVGNQRRCTKVSRKLIEKLENGKVNPTLYTLLELANALEISLGELVDLK
ncbi:helix-turn-helix transcriptional regulator [Chryseobacterium sp. MHB01]|uniref:helix-turn-helix transcriptional regulator n=1 Tax=Chryseobacterium sp. MHB01 TaxID=3109433 RepID=UPI002AFE2F63|nr:helix-turn-helix transcriptional regulator [Chryseobacterium sp. MHB01]MEA1849100.1 helix-turn-helix transcriptional regulator [Chryseobacterium sp. MHB01]